MNRLRLDVRGKIAGRRVHDVDRVRFAAVDVPDGAPVARAFASTSVLLAGVPAQFDGGESHDPDGDPLVYRWDFGDGTTSSDPRPVHVFATADHDATVRLTVSDGQLDAAEELVLLAVPPPCAGCTPGVLRVEATGPLEFGGVALGGSRTLQLTVRNLDATPTSNLHARLGTSGGAFTVTPTDVELGAGESAPVDVVFAPAAAGHQSTRITVAASATNQTAVSVLAHGFGGVAPGTGPLPTSEPAFFEDATGTQGILPSGARFTADDSVRTCRTPGVPPSFGDYCLTDKDCVVRGSTCPASGTCIGGDRAGARCTRIADCPRGFGCTSAVPFGPVKMCGDGVGGLFLLSDEDTYTDPSTSDAPLSSTLMHVAYDASGRRTGAEIVTRLTENTSQIACDAVPPAARGQVYVAEYRAVASSGSCLRDAREALIGIRKSNGNQTQLVSRIDAAEGLAPCDDYDPVDDLEVVRDGSAVFAALPVGIIRIRPTALLMTPDIDDVFQVHPDGSVLVAVQEDHGATGILKLYKISPAQAAHGAPHLADLAPCATIDVPSNRGVQSGPLTIILSFAVDPVQRGSFDATVLVSFFTTGGGTPGPGRAAPLAPVLQARGTYAISSPAGSSTCQVVGLVDLEALSQLAF
jgi:hypothetical protein